jgi:hypothetical protein
VSGSDFLGFVAVSCLLSAIGQGINRWVFGDKPKAGRQGWRGVWYVTLWAHPILAGGLLGWCVPSLHVPPGMGEGAAGRVIWYALAGAIAPAVYSAVRGVLKQRAALASVPHLPIHRDRGLP